jgi:rhodanese-related sulfurtransferase
LTDDVDGLVAGKILEDGFMSTLKLATPNDVDRLRTSFRVVDVREPVEFTGELGHIAEAELVPLGTVMEAAASWDKSAPIILVCRSGARSGRAGEALVAMGFEHVTNMVGGMIAWNQDGLPTV